MRPHEIPSSEDHRDPKRCPEAGHGPRGGTGFPLDTGDDRVLPTSSRELSALRFARPLKVARLFAVWRRKWNLALVPLSVTTRALRSNTAGEVFQATSYSEPRCDFFHRVSFFWFVVSFACVCVLVSCGVWCAHIMPLVAISLWMTETDGYQTQQLRRWCEVLVRQKTLRL